MAERHTDLSVITSKSKTSLSRKGLMGCKIGGAKSKETRYSMLKRGLVGSYISHAVLNLQMKKPIRKCRTVIVVGSYQTSL